MYQVIPDPRDADKNCPICGDIMDVTLVDDGTEVIHIRVCANCGHGDVKKIR